jgi:hypothetical protein
MVRYFDTHWGGTGLGGNYIKADLSGSHFRCGDQYAAYINAS